MSWRNQIKRFLPHRLFWRALIIVITPLLLVQIIGTLIYYDRHVEAITRRLTLGVGGDINMVIEQLELEPDQEDTQYFLTRAQHNMGLSVNLIKNKHFDDVLLPSTTPSLIRRKMYLSFSEALKQPFILDTESHEKLISLWVSHNDDLLQFQFSKKRVSTSTTYVFILWSWGLSLILVAISIIFLRNQVRPILHLAHAAETFGRGRDLEEPFKPSGAREVRRAGIAFIDMRNRIQRHISQRTEMLAGVSHDLRTPLTRMRLQLAMIADADTVKPLKQDISEMESMINGYLDFARGQVSEPAIEKDLVAITLEAVEAATRMEFDVTMVNTEDSVAIILRPNSFRRALSNILENARRYADQAIVSVENVAGIWRVIIDDDGPGIPGECRTEVFRPFRRLDSSRNTQTGGSGLGLTIVRDIMRGMGGDIRLGDSPLGGLRVELLFPR